MVMLGKRFIVMRQSFQRASEFSRNIVLYKHKISSFLGLLCELHYDGSSVERLKYVDGHFT